MCVNFTDVLIPSVALPTEGHPLSLQTHVVWTNYVQALRALYLRSSQQLTVFQDTNHVRLNFQGNCIQEDVQDSLNIPIGYDSAAIEK